MGGHYDPQKRSVLGLFRVGSRSLNQPGRTSAAPNRGCQDGFALLAAVPVYSGRPLWSACRGVFRSPNRKEATYGVVGGLGLYVVNIVLGVLSVWIALRFLDPDLVQNLILRERAGANVLLTSNEPLIVLGTMLLLTVGAPLGEELFFRGLLVDLWRETLGARAAILLGAVLFAFLHFYVLQFIPVLISGIVLGILFVRFENVVVPIFADSVVNSLVLVIWLWAL